MARFDNIKEFRKSKGMNQSEFWGPLGVTQSGGSRYESERNIPAPVKKLLEIAYGTESMRKKALAGLGVKVGE